jgi:hypothetical protein
MNSGDRLSISLDGNALLMDVDCGAEHARKNWDGPQPAIEKLDLSADKAVRVTGKDDFVWEPFWLSANEFLCIIQKENENQTSIYRMSLGDKNSKLLVKHARAHLKTIVATGLWPVPSLCLLKTRKRPTGPWLHSP